jgi:hypothetical protein
VKDVVMGTEEEEEEGCAKATEAKETCLIDNKARELINGVVDSEEAFTTNEQVGQKNAVLYSRAKDDLKLSLAIGCHFNPLTLPNQYRLPFTKLDNITPEMIIAGFGLLEYAIGRQGGGKVVCLKPQNNNRFQCCMGCHFVNLLLWTVF